MGHRAGSALAWLLLAAPALAATAAVPPAKEAAGVPGVGVGTATEYRSGAPIRAVFSKAVTISPLRLRFTTAPPLPQPGQRVTVTLTVTNAGAAPVVGLKPVLAVVSGSAICSSLAGPVPPGPVQAAPGAALSFAWTLTLGGRGAVTLRADVSGTITGQGAVGGSGTVTVSAPGVSRLTAWLTPSPLTVTKGQWFALEVTVSNTGDLAAAGVQPAVQATGNPALVTFQRGPEPKKPQPVPPGGMQIFRFTYSANGSGTVSFTVTVAGGSDISGPSAVTVATARTIATAGVMIREAVASTTTWAAATKLRLFPPAPPPPAEPPFMSFETPRDLAWETDGYVKITLASTRYTDGMHAAEITFALPGDFTLSPTGEFRPTLRRTWPERGSAAPLAPRDWSPYTAFKSDWYNAAKQPVTLHVTLVDQHGFRHEELRTLPAASATIVTLDLAGVREDRLDVARLSALEFGVDTGALAARPVLYLDRLRFAVPPPPPPVVAVLPLSRTATGAGPVRAPSGRPAATP